MRRDPRNNRYPSRFIVSMRDGDITAGIARAALPMMTDGWPRIGARGIASHAGESGRGCGGGGDAGIAIMAHAEDMPVVVGGMEGFGGLVPGIAGQLGQSFEEPCWRER